MEKLCSLARLPAADVEQLLDDAFGTDRHRRTAYLLRKGMPVIDHLSFGIHDGKAVVGSIQCWPIAVEGAPLVLVGPVAVSPARQNSGFGKQLMNAMLAAVSETDAPMVMIGDPEYYGRFGFDASETGEWTLPGPFEPRRLLLRNPYNVTLPVTGMLGPRTRL